MNNVIRNHSKNLFRSFLFFLGYLSTASSPLHAELAHSAIYTAKSFSDLHDIRYHFTQDTWLVLDIDQVLINDTFELIEPNITPHFITDLQGHRIKANVVALTTTGTGYVEALESLTPRAKTIEEWKVSLLQKKGITFSSIRNYLTAGLSHYTPIAIFPEEIYDDRPKSPPLLYQGIIFASCFTKGSALKSFFRDVLKTDLENEAAKPKCIIFVDDLMENLMSVKTFCDTYNIMFVGVHFLPTSPDTPITLTREVLRELFIPAYTPRDERSVIYLPEPMGLESPLLPRPNNFPTPNRFRCFRCCCAIM